MSIILFICLNAAPRSHVADIHKPMKVSYLCDRRESHILMFMSKMRHKQNLVDMRPIRTRAHDGLLFLVPRPHINALKRSLRYAGATAWNSLPVGLRSMDDPFRLKSLLKHNLITKIIQYN